MEGIDKEKQAQIIYEMSKDSAHFKRAAKLDAETDVKVQAMKETLVSFKGSVEKRLRESVAEQSLNLESRRSMDRICCVLDMDMFYAAVEIRDQPHLKDLPVAVGGMSMISTANYVARKFGVRAAMPGFIAKKLCPHLVFVHCNFDKYKLVSDQIKSIIGEYDPSYRSHSLDEVYFDLTSAARAAWCGQHGYSPPPGPAVAAARDVKSSDCHMEGDWEGQHLVTRSSYGSGVADADRSDSGASDGHHADASSEAPSALQTALLIQRYPHHLAAAYETVPSDDRPDIFSLRAIAATLLHEIRARITAVTQGLTCSAGLANNFYLAKICADVNKPNGQFELPPTRDEVLRFVSELLTRKIGGIGKVTERMLERLLEIKTMQQVRDRLPELMHTCTPILFHFLLRTSLGIGSEEGCEEDGPEEGDSASKRPYQRKSLGCERTYSAKGISDPAELYEKLHKICANVGEDMVSDDLYAKAVTLKLKDTEFTLTTRCATSPSYIQSAEQIEAIARTLLDEALPMKVRLMGVTLSKFRHAEQAESDPKQRNLLSFLQNRGGEAATKEGKSAYGEKGESPVAQKRDGKDPGSEQDEVLDEERGAAQPQFGIDQWLTSGTAAATAQPAGADGHRSAAAGNQCPVCEQVVPGTLMQLNTHLDSCLGICALSAVSSSSSSAATSSAVAAPSTTSSASSSFSAVTSRVAPTGNSKPVETKATVSVSSKRVVDKKSHEEPAGKKQKGDPLVLSIPDYFAVSRK
jgi:DNA polymerase kappa